jgi:hypothetical protein
MASPIARRSGRLFATTLALAPAAVALFASTADAAPPIRTSAANPVPACVTPDRLMAFLAQRNPQLDPRYTNIAKFYKVYGEGWHVRWDFAFFQMAIETNFLKFRRADGRRGDVRETQNNFAGIGATGNGVPGERFADVATGVHAQIQHLVAYSGERLAQPIAKRTRNNQNDIIEKSHRLGRPVTFGDLARRWAADRHYGKSIDFIAGQYKDQFCAGEEQSAQQDTTSSAPQPMYRWRGLPPQPSGLGAPRPELVVDPKESR